MAVIGGTQYLAKLATALDDSPGLLIKAGQGVLHGWSLQNGAAAATYVQVFDAAALANVTLGTTTPSFVICMAASEDSNIVGADWAFTLGCVAFSTTSATGSTGATTNGSFFYA